METAVSRLGVTRFRLLLDQSKFCISRLSQRCAKLLQLATSVMPQPALKGKRLEEGEE
jgi:hypothetical protein